ncbi:hypothetical protein [Streptomonospora salina]|uniref:Uncharacterized protein n=1 Tax=Streptomonospora salina TaxID=104205 RepID=A0A841EHX9_9ACTN|nr:hypothetical protein [Streptomonospora salina]MBB5999021.1 hypothetical protein [Streptomonospora salina]
MRAAKGLVESPRSWRDVPESGAVYRIGAEAGAVLMEWRPAPDGRCVDVFIHRAVYDRRRGVRLALPAADFQLRLFNRIRFQSWDPCIYPLGFPRDREEGGAP